jgi:hypothetical protein
MWDLDLIIIIRHDLKRGNHVGEAAVRERGKGEGVGNMSEVLYMKIVIYITVIYIYNKSYK